MKDHPRFDQLAHDSVMATPPVSYRGYTLRPTSFRHQPYYDQRGWTFWGWIVVHADGYNAGPGATWAYGLGGAKTIVDCLLEAGERPQPAASTAEHEAWTARFWALMRERQPPRPELTPSSAP